MTAGIFLLTIYCFSKHKITGSASDNNVVFSYATFFL
jgi:hypothetical protein